MADLLFRLPSTIIFGTDAINRIGSLTAAIGERALLITEFVLHDAQIIEKVAELLKKKNIDVITLDNMSPGKIFGSTKEIVDLAKASRTQVIIGMGGMRVLSLARKVACLAASSGDGEAPQKALPYIEVPTVARDTLLFTDQYVDFDIVTRMPKLAPAPRNLVNIALLDPNLSITLPPKTVGTHVMDILLSAVEGIISTKANFISDALLYESITALGDAVLVGIKNPRELAYRSKASEAGLLAAMGYAMSSGGPGTAIAFAVNTLYRVPKSFVSSVILPHLLDFASNINPERIAKIATALGEDTFGLPTSEAARLASAAVRRMVGQLQLPARLRDFNLKMENLAEAAEAVSSIELVQYSKVPLGTDGLYELLKKAF
jgi:alcohol dehydrogenase